MLQQVAGGFTHPIWIGSPPDETQRLFVVDQIGVVRIVTADGNVLPEPFLDVSSLITPLMPEFDERGLLSIAFHPDFANNGKVYAFWTAPLREGAPEGWDHTNVVSEFTVNPASPNAVDPNTRRDIIMIDQPYFNHNGGQVLFGPDGYLYMTIGDGGNRDDEGIGHNPVIGNAQDLNNIHGKILRIDVNARSDGNAYGIPSDNPFVGGAGLPEIYAYGFRNPAFASFDEPTGRLFVADAGQDRFEEVNIVVKGGNYGWRIKEGFHCFDPNKPFSPIVGCPNAGANGQPLMSPIVEFNNAKYPGGEGYVVAGGVVYRGTAMPQMQGVYVFGTPTNDLTRGNASVFIASPPAADGQPWVRDRLNVNGNPNGTIPVFLMGLGEDWNNELWVGSSDVLGPQGQTGKLWRVVPAA